MRKKDNNIWTYGSKEYKVFVVKPKLRCTYCPPNKGCNRNNIRFQRNWKKYRKTQWKNPIVHRVEFGE